MSGKRSPMLTKLWVLAPILIIALLITGCSVGFSRPDTGKIYASPPSPPTNANLPTNGLVQSTNSKAVTIEVKWLGLRESVLAFDVSMNTHSVDLDSYDLGKLTVLKDDAGNEYRPVDWDSAPGSHHRSGTLAFPVPDSISQGKAQYLKMLIRNVDGVKEQVLKWQL